jgi:hypothetical protein
MTAIDDAQAARLRAAHAQASAWREMGLPIPRRTEELEREYQRWVKNSRRPARRPQGPRRPGWQVRLDALEADRARIAAEQAARRAAHRDLGPGRPPKRPRPAVVT